jgi:hypothetical protein
MAKEFGADLKTICKEFEEISPEILTANLPHEKSSKIKGKKYVLLLKCILIVCRFIEYLGTFVQEQRVY